MSVPRKTTYAAVCVLLVASVITPPFAGAQSPRNTAQKEPGIPADRSVRSERASRVPDEVTATGRYVVAYRPGKAGAARKAAEANGGKVESPSASSDYFVVRLPSKADPKAFAARMKVRPEIAYVEPVYLREISLVPNDTLWSELWNVGRVGAPAAWDSTRGDPNIKIAVVDSGVDAEHPDLAGRVDVANGFNLVDDTNDTSDVIGHGTHVAGIAAATADNALGVAGIADGCTILPVKVVGPNGTAASVDIAEGIRHAVDNDAKVINLSLAGYSYSQLERDAVAYARSKDVVIVAAAGNDNIYPVSYPARYPDVIAVGSTGSGAGNPRSAFSNFGPQLDLVAPGENIFSTVPTDTIPPRPSLYEPISGTSMASPHVAGAAALLASKNTTWTATQIEAALKASAQDLGISGRDDLYGFGLLRIDRAMQAAVPPSMPGIGDDNIPGVALTASPVSGSLDVLADSNDVFGIDLKADDQLSVSLTAAAGADYDVYVYGPKAGDVDIDAPLAGTSTGAYPRTLNFTASSAGRHYICVFAYSGTGSYKVTYSKKSPTISISAPTQTSWGGTAAISTKYSVPRSGRAVTLEQRIDGGNWTAVGTKTTGTNGSVSFTAKPARRTYYRVSVPYGNSKVFSATKTVTPRPYLTISAPTDVKTASSFTVTGYLKPKHVAGAKDVAIKCYLNGTLKKTVYATNANYTSSTGSVYTKYSAKFTLPERGAWTLKAYVPGDSMHATYTTAGKTVNVNRPKLSIYSDRTTVTYGKPATISGYLKTRAGTPLSGRKVKLQKSKDGSSWTTVETLTTSSKGRAAGTVKPSTKTMYRLRFSGDTKYMAINSSTKTISPKKFIGSGTFSVRFVQSPDYSLSSGKHRIKVIASREIRSVYIRNYERTWLSKLSSGSIPSQTTKTYYVSVPRSGKYHLVFENASTGKNNYVKWEIW